jgi:hypothetical protein
VTALSAAEDKFVIRKLDDVRAGEKMRKPSSSRRLT